MVVLHIISGGEAGGSKKHLLTLVEEMKKRDTKNIIVCFIKGELYEEAKNMGLNIYLVKQEKRFDLSVINKIKEICIKENVDIINSHGGRANFICYFLKKKVKAKYITTIHSDYESDYKGNTYKTFIYTKINKIALKSFDYYIGVSKSFKDLLTKRGFKENKIFTIYNGIDTEKELSTISIKEAVKKYSLKEFDNYISMVARLHPIKGHKDFLDACENIYDKFQGTGILLVGDGDFKDEIEKHIDNYKIKDNVMFLGFRMPDDFFSISSFTVLTSYSESFPLVILESGLYGKCVVASNVGGIPEIIKDKENGMLITPRCIENISENLSFLLDNKEISEKMGKNLKKDVLEKFSIKSLGDSYEEIWNISLVEE